jgi:hypothetical protein
MLREAKLMDYSLLLIVAYNPGQSKMTQEDVDAFGFSTGNSRYAYRTFVSANGKYVYCLGLIDYLQKFNLSKFLENKYKSLLYGRDVKNISAVDPVIYSKRMIEFLADKFKK